MRRQDLRKFDIYLTISVLSTFCGISLIFILILVFNLLSLQEISLSFLLWSSFIIFFLISLVVYLTTQQPTIVWTAPVPEKELKSRSKYKLTPRHSYIIKTQKKTPPRRIFNDITRHGKKGMFITRTNPNIIQKRFDLRNTFILWLTEIKTKNAIDPLDIEELNYTIKRFLRKTTNTIVLLEGIDYLSNVLPFKKVLHFVQDLRDEIAEKNSNLILRFNPESFKPRQARLIEKELELLKHGI